MHQTSYLVGVRWVAFSGSVGPVLRIAVLEPQMGNNNVQNPQPKRRDFLKTAAASAAGAMGLTALKFDKLLAQSTGGWTMVCR